MNAQERERYKQILIEAAAFSHARIEDSLWLIEQLDAALAEIERMRPVVEAAIVARSESGTEDDDQALTDAVDAYEEATK